MISVQFYYEITHPDTLRWKLINLSDFIKKVREILLSEETINTSLQTSKVPYSK